MWMYDASFISIYFRNSNQNDYFDYFDYNDYFFLPFMHIFARSCKRLTNNMIEAIKMFYVNCKTKLAEWVAHKWVKICVQNEKSSHIWFDTDFSSSM